jgi:asparagine synthase (glutamine-hydrolysing)
MCGIYGQLWFDPAAFTPEVEVLERCRLMGHRGPDGEGAWSRGRIALGHRRLSIIDLNSGQQPMPYADGRYWITFNGEIYNYRELRGRLQGLGYAFQTTSDTEVILAAYAHWGETCSQYLNGIFAFAIWDQEREVLFLARDHLGIKPLLYHHDEEAFTFCSELKPLMAEPRITAGGFSRQGITDYLALGYTLSPNTIMEGIHRLPAAHYLIVKDRDIRIHPYWQLADFVNQPPIQEDAHLVEQFRAELDTAVHRQMVADVRVGAFLSGGVDSSSVTALMCDHADEPPFSFSIGFSEKSYNELDYAQRVADRLGTRHITGIIRGDDLPDELPNIVWLYDEPLGDTSVISMYFLSRIAAQQVKVVLSGDGADENLAGYDTYIADWLHGFYHRIPRPLQNGLIKPLVAALPSSPGKVNWQYQLEQFTRYGHETPQTAHYRWRELFTDGERADLLGGDSAPYIQHTLDCFVQHYEPVKRAHPLNQALYVDMHTWMLDDILPKVDRASMAASLESRVPFLDVWLVEYMMRLPVSMKMRGTARKVILKQAMRDKLPAEVLTRRKRGFNAPTSVWMSGVLRDLIDDLLHTPSTLIDTQSPTLHGIWKDYLNGKANHGYKLWSLVSLLLWEQHVWKKLTAAPITIQYRDTILDGSPRAI